MAAAAAAATAVRSSLLLLSILPSMVEEKTEAFVADGCNRNGRPWKLSALGEQAVWE
jgi:hypothetical protein